MRRRPAGAFLIYILMGCMILWPIWQLYDWYGAKKNQGDADRLLFQVSLFQMELLGSFMNEAAEMKDTKELDQLKQAAYSADYTHEQLTAAVGADRLSKLESLDAIQQFVLRLQIGGERSLKPEETATLKEAAALYRSLFEAYGRLLSSDGKPLSGQTEKLNKADKDLTKALKKNIK